MRYFKKLEGEKVYLSPIAIEDAEQYTYWFNNLDLTDKIGKSSEMMTIKAEEEWIEKTLKNNEFVFAIIRFGNDELLGNCGLTNINYKDRTAELGIFIGSEYNRQKGYGTDALNILLDFGFNYLNLNNIELQVKSFNENAISKHQVYESNPSFLI